MPSVNLNQQQLFETALQAGKAAFAMAIAQYNSEHFYAFCFCTDSDITSIYPMTNTLEGLERIFPKDEDADKAYYRWVPAEWQLTFGQFGEPALMSQSSQLLAPDYANENEESIEAFNERKRQTLATLSRVLLNIRESGLFDHHAVQKQLAFWVDLGDAMDEEVTWILQPVQPHLGRTDFEELRSQF